MNDTLFDLDSPPPTDEPPLRARGSDPDTSHEAMARFDPDKMTSAAHVAANVHRLQGPLADYEFKDLFAEAWAEPCCDHLYQQARSSARDRGWIRDSGVRNVNPTTGRRQAVWEFCDDPAPAIRRCSACGHVLSREDVKT